MATLTSRSEVQVLSNQVATLLSAYERFDIQQDYPGISGYAMSLKTDIYVHRVHTKKDLYNPTSFWVGSTTTALPSMGFIKEWLKHSREATLKKIKQGIYVGQVRVGGEWQSVDYKFNRWFYFDHPNNRVLGQVQVIDLVELNSKPPKTHTKSATPTPLSKQEDNK